MPSPLLGILSLLALSWTSIGIAQDPAPPPSIGGHDAQWWNERCSNHGSEVRAELVARGADAVPMLRWLAAHGNQYARWHGAVGLGELGAAGRPSADLLLALYRASDASSWPKSGYLEALTLLGDDRPAILELLLSELTSSESGALRSQCIDSLVRLHSDAVALVLDSVDGGRFDQAVWAVEALVRVGEPASGALLAAIEVDAPRRDVAREALVGLGWAVADRLDKRGHADLAHRCLTEGALQGILGIEPYRIARCDPEPMATLLPEITLCYGYGHGHGLAVWHGAEGATGFELRSVSIRSRREGDEQVWDLRVQELVLPRDRVLALARQLALLGRLGFEAVEGEPEHWMSTGNFCAYVHAKTQAKALIDATFAGNPQGDNVLERVHAEAARNALLSLVRGAEWRDREIGPADRAALRRCATALGSDTRWVAERLAVLDGLLGR